MQNPPLFPPASGGGKKFPPSLPALSEACPEPVEWAEGKKREMEGDFSPVI